MNKILLRLTLKWTACLFLLPLIIIQGAWIKRIFKKLVIASPPNEGVFSPNITDEGNGFLIAGVGDSVIAGIGVNEMRESLTARLAEKIAVQSPLPVRWLAYGCDGDRARDLLGKIPNYPRQNADLVVISIGVNDVMGMTSVTRWQFEITAIIGALREAFRAPIVFVGLPPMGRFPALPQPLRYAMGIRAELLDLMLRNAATVIHDVYWIDSSSFFDASHLAADGFHPNESACDLIAGQIMSTTEIETLLKHET